MTIHKEGHKILLVLAVFLIAVNTAAWMILPTMVGLKYSLLVFSVLVFGLILQFFRNPIFPVVIEDNKIIAPADGKIVVIEEVLEMEYFNERRRQISIFMTPFNVHVNRNPITDIVKYFKYHEGKYLVAWHPKSSTENERTTVVIENNKKQSILMRQIAGALARRIVWYIKQDDSVKQGDEFGFIKFGSRVDVFVPLDAKVLVKIGEKSKGGRTILAEF